MIKRITRSLLSSHHSKPLLCLGLLLIGVPSGASAQTMMSDWLPSITLNNLQNQVLWAPYQETKKNQQNPTSAPPQPVANPVALRFTFDPVLRKTVVNEFATVMNGHDPATPLGRFFASDPIGAEHKRMVALGLSPNNLGDVMTMFIASNWAFARGQAARPSRATMLAFRAQVGGSFATTPSLSKMSNAAKQRQADSALLLIAITAGVIEGARDNPKELKNAAASASQTLKNIGLDSAQFELTPQGMSAAE